MMHHEQLLDGIAIILKKQKKQRSVKKIIIDESELK
jgi:hypothetical protein